MRLVIQRVSEAAVKVDGKTVSAIQHGLLILAGIEEADTIEDAGWLAQKTAKLRIFADENGIMNKDITEVKGEMLVVSQFTLHALTKKGNRPSYIRAARPEQAIPLYEKLVEFMYQYAQVKVQTGVFGADMKVSLVNDGPVTILIDSRNKE